MKKLRLKDNAILEAAKNSHLSGMQQGEALYADPILTDLYLRDAAHALVPTLAQSAAQAIEYACLAADFIVRSTSLGN